MRFSILTPLTPRDPHAPLTASTPVPASDIGWPRQYELSAVISADSLQDAIQWAFLDTDTAKVLQPPQNKPDLGNGTVIAGETGTFVCRTGQLDQGEKTAACYRVTDLLAAAPDTIGTVYLAFTNNATQLKAWCGDEQSPRLGPVYVPVVTKAEMATDAAVGLLMAAWLEKQP